MAALEASAPHSAELEARLCEVETRLVALGNALRARDPIGIDLHAAELHCALASAVSEFSDAAKSGPLPPALRHRLASAGGQVAAQRESLARATAALDRAIDVLMPGDSLHLYSAVGSADRGLMKSGVIQA
ncbi:MAG: hypothetical protein ABIQ33_03150 [Caldimonas sp.]